MSMSEADVQRFRLTHAMEALAKNIYLARGDASGKSFPEWSKAGLLARDTDRTWAGLILGGIANVGGAQPSLQVMEPAVPVKPAARTITTGLRSVTNGPVIGMIAPPEAC